MAAKTLFGKPARFEPGLTEVAAGTFAWLQPNGELGESNAGLVVGDGASLLVDTLWDLRLTGAMLDGMQAQTADAPIATLVNTHADGDHTWGNQLLGAEVEIVAGEATAHEFGEVKPQVLQTLRKAAGPAGLLGRAPLPFPGRTQMRGMSGFASQIAPYDFAGIELRPPSRTFSGRLELDAGGRTVELIEVGPAHTLGDTLVWVPDVRVLYAADIVFSGVAPIMWAGPVDGWLAALDTAAALEPAVVVPGHGPPGGPELLDHIRAYWTWLREAAPEHADKPLDEAARALLKAPGFAQFADLDDPARIVVSLHVIRTGGTVSMTTPERLTVLGTAAQLRAELS